MSREDWTRPTGISSMDLSAALDRLDPDDRALLAMRYVAGFDSNELAASPGHQPVGHQEPARAATQATERGTRVMDEMDAFDRQLASVVLRRVGPSAPVDDAAIFSAITATQSPKWRFQSMFSATKFVVAGAIVALFGGFLLRGPDAAE